MPTRRKYTDEDRAKAAAAGVDMATVHRRVHDGMSKHEALTTPKRKPGDTGRINSRNPSHPWASGRCTH